MARKGKIEKRKIDADPKYHRMDLAKLINKVMKNGKKTLAQNIVYRAMDSVVQKLNVSNPMEIFERAVENAKPHVEVKSRRIGGATYQVPIDIPEDRRSALATKWIVLHARSKRGKGMMDGLAMEICDCYNNCGLTIKKRDDVHRMAESNRAFAHYKW